MRFCCPSIPRPVSPQGWLILHAAAGVICLIAADWLFFKRSVGISFALFVIFLALVCACVNPLRATAKEIKRALLILAAGLAALVYDFNWLSCFFGVLALALFSQILSGAQLRLWLDRTRQCFDFAWAGYIWLPRDLHRGITLWKRRRPGKSWYASLALWTVPVVLGSIFVALFAQANPLIDNFLSALDLSMLWPDITFLRAYFWLLLLGLVWPYLHMPCARNNEGKLALACNAALGSLNLPKILSQAVLLRSLLLFNALFAVQTCLDVAYLWGGLRLPDAMSYASYAHRGAYPLCCTALIAGAFALAASTNAGAGGSPGLLRTLLVVWVGQNVLLVISSLVRLDLYVAAYSLTELRVAAFLWMGLVGFGLLCIIVKIYWRKSGVWLIGANALAAGVTLYLCCFVNFPLVIAQYNVDHAYPQGLNGLSKLDERYLISLGSQAIPALDAYIETCRICRAYRRNLADDRALLVNAFRNEQNDWRAFSLRSWSLARYLSNVSASDVSLSSLGAESKEVVRR